MRLEESEEADGESQIPEGHSNLTRGASHVWGGGPVRLPLLRPPYEASNCTEAVEDSEKEVQPGNRRIQGYEGKDHGGKSVEHQLSTITDTDKGGLPHNRVDEAGKIGNRRGQQKCIYQLHAREREYVF